VRYVQPTKTHIDTPGKRCQSAKGRELQICQVQHIVMGFRTSRSTHHTDNHTYPPGFLVAKHPDAIREKVLDDQGNHCPDKRHFECGYVRVGQAVHVPEAGGEPVVQVCTAHRCLYRLN